MGVVLSIIPRLNYNIGERWVLDLNIPVNLADMNRNMEKVENPSTEVSEQKTTSTEFLLLPEKFQVRLGLGLRI